MSLQLTVCPMPLKVIYANTQQSVDSSLFNADFLGNFIIISSRRSAGLRAYYPVN